MSKKSYKFLSSLPPHIIRFRSGKLDHEQFALAMWLVKQTLSGVEPPKKLAPEMVPPSVRDVKLLVGQYFLGGSLAIFVFLAYNLLLTHVITRQIK